MQQSNLFSIFTDPISKSGLKYFIGGSVASIVYGEPRLTHDIDLIIYLANEKVEQFLELFPDNEFYRPPIEVARNEIKLGEKGHFNIIHHETGFKADIYFVGNDTLQNWALENIIEIDFMNTKLPIAPIEYIIVKKLIYFREGKSHKHLDDIKSMLSESSDLIERTILQEFLNQYNVTDLYDQNFGHS